MIIYLVVAYGIEPDLYHGIGEEFNSGGVAYGAHIGGFIAGAILIKFFCSQKLIPNKPNKGSVPNAK